MSIIEAENLKKQFGKKVLFEDLYFQIKAGEMVAVTGKSGCGKTTLLNILGLIEPFDSGKVRIVGRPAPRPNSRAA